MVHEPDWFLAKVLPNDLMAKDVFPSAIERLKIVDRLSANLLRVPNEG